jgi:prevent-host-death family protein
MTIVAKNRVAIFMAMYKTINVADLKNRLSENLEAVERGQELVICRRNIPIARVTAMPLRRNTTKLGFDAARVQLRGDVTGPAVPDSDWNALSDDQDPLK